MGAVKGKAQTKSPRVRAQVLVEAEFATDAATAERYGISERTLQRWRQDVPNDPELAGEVARLHEILLSQWEGRLVRTLVRAADRAYELLPQLGRDDIRDVLATMETIGSIIVPSQALGRRGRKSDGSQPAATRDGAPPRADGGDPRSSPRH